MSLRGVVLIGLALALAGCPKSKDEGGGAPASSASVAAAASSVTSSKSDASPSAVAAAPVGDGGAASTSTSPSANAYAGSYTLAPAALYIPAAKDWSSVKQAKDEPTKLVGDGTMTLAVGGGGRVTGTLDTGPGSPAVIEGSAVEGELRGVVRRKDPSDEGLTGTLVGTVSGDTVTGKLALAESNAAVIRDGKFTIKKK